MESVGKVTGKDSLVMQVAEVQSVLEVMRSGLDQGYQWFVWASDEMGMFKTYAAVMDTAQNAEDFCWHPYAERPFRGVRLFPAYQATLQSLDAIQRSAGDFPKAIFVPLDGIEIIDPLKSRMQRNFEDLEGTIVRLFDWDSDLSRQLADGMYAKAGSFAIDITPVPAKDNTKFSLFFEINDLGVTAMKYLQVEGIRIPDIVVNGVMTAYVEERARHINWLSPFSMEQKESFYKDLEKLRADPSGKGKEIVARLYHKYLKEPFVLGYPEKTPPHLLEKQQFGVGNGLMLDLEMAQNLFEGRPVFTRIQQPGDNMKTRSWFILDRSVRDNAGNALLLQYKDAFNFEAREGMAFIESTKLSNLPKELISAPGQLFRGSITDIHIDIDGETRIATMVPDPLNRRFALRSMINRKHYENPLQPLAVGSQMVFPLARAYDGWLNKVPLETPRLYEPFQKDQEKEMTADVEKKPGLKR